MRFYSNEPEPIPVREPGYYWVLVDNSLECEITYYGPVTMRDQLAGMQDNQIICDYEWSVMHSDETYAEKSIMVVSDRLSPPR